MPKKTMSPEEQLERFRQTARELGADESERAFDDKLKRIAKAKPQVASQEVRPRKRKPRT